VYPAFHLVFFVALEGLAALVAFLGDPTKELALETFFVLALLDFPDLEIDF
jgi:hypothetical protein